MGFAVKYGKNGMAQRLKGSRFTENRLFSALNGIREVRGSNLQSPTEVWRFTHTPRLCVSVIMSQYISQASVLIPFPRRNSTGPLPRARQLENGPVSQEVCTRSAL